MTRLSLEKIAAKLHWFRNQGSAGADKLLATPRYAEALCFLEKMSRQPGGLEKFADTFLQASGDWVSSLPAQTRSNSVGGGNFAWPLQRWCEDQNVDCLRDFLFDRFDRMFPGFLAALCRFMDDYAEAELSKTADTSLRRTVFRELDFARTSEPPVPMILIADTRHGKTTAVATYCQAWPGQARLVTVPESNHEREFYAAYAEAFGIDCTPATQTRALKDRVQFTLRNTGLFCIHDEAHFLVPLRYQKNTPPQRLNWVRAKIVDRHLPCAFFCTPQSQEETLARYVEKTHANMEQWLGRMPKPVLISDKPTYQDLVSVARVRFPEFSQPALDELCDAADEKVEGAGARLNGEGGFKIIELGGARARYLAAQRGGKVTLADIREAVAWAGAPLPEAAPPRSAKTEEITAIARGGLGQRTAPAGSSRRCGIEENVEA